MNLDRVIAVRNTKTVYRDGDRCIKVFDESYPKSAILNEALNMARMEEAGINVHYRTQIKNQKMSDLIRDIIKN